MNGDHHQDLVSLDAKGSLAVSVLLGNGDGTFQPAVSLPETHAPTAIAVGDFNGDGIPDIAVANANDGSGGFGRVSLFVGNGNGTFQDAALISIGNNNAQFAVAGDFNNDGKLDLAITNQSGTVDVILGNGDGTFQAPTTPTALGGQLVTAIAVDLNGDGNLDLIVGNGHSTENTVFVLLGKRDGTFQAPTSYSYGKDVEGIAVADFNGDDRLDIALANAGVGNGDTGSVIVLRGSGNGTFSPTAPIIAGVAPFAFAISDFDGDGHPDLAVANISLNSVSLLINAQP
jgi:hypothetical protein